MVTFDEAKRLRNRTKRGIDLAAYGAIFDEPMLTIEDTSAEYGEQRLRSLGLLRGRVVVRSGRIVRRVRTSFPAAMGTKVKLVPTSAPGPEEQVAQRAMEAAADEPVADAENPPTRPEDWGNAIRSHSLPELRDKLAQRRGRTSSVDQEKVETLIPFDADVLAGIKATGNGWRERVNEAVREWLETH
jgi:uncharacterized protein (DUF4415 family)/uncharacterized DUF497 family protein